MHSRSGNPRRNKHDRQNIKRTVAKRQMNPLEPREGPNKDDTHPVHPGRKD